MQHVLNDEIGLEPERKTQLQSLVPVIQPNFPYSVESLFHQPVETLQNKISELAPQAITGFI